MLETIERYFSPAQTIYVLEFDPAPLEDAVVWESVPTRAGRLFPHVYAPFVPMSLCRAVYPVIFDQSGCRLGPALAWSAE